jgi:serine/threonine protein kinase
MSSGTLPFANYHRASQLGSGTYGSVVCAYNEDGDEVALKVFRPSENDDDDDDDREEGLCTSPVELGTLREISCLRLLRGENAHPNITTLIDVQPHWTDAEYEDDDDENGDPAQSEALCMALPLYHCNSLHHALSSGYHFDRREKVEIAHGILSAVAYLHDNGILHRDIKPDNIMLEQGDNNENLEKKNNSKVISNSENSDRRNHPWRPVLIDFSLAKQARNVGDGAASDSEEVQHTGGAGTATYMAPEVVAHELYGSTADLWSVGVVLLEILSGCCIPAQKEKHAAAWIETTLASLPDLPFPNLIRKLLDADPNLRWTARQALDHELFTKFGLLPPSFPPSPINIAAALPLDVDDIAVPKKRLDRVDRVCRYLECENPQTKVAALEYAAALSQLDDAVDDAKSPLLLHCVILSYRFHEVNVLDLDELNDATKGIFADWTLADYVDEEATIFLLLDFCLYPRGILQQC